MFNISSIQVTGVKYCNGEDVIKASGVIKGTNGFKNIGVVCSFFISKVWTS